MKVVFLASARADVRWFELYYRTVFRAGLPRARTRLEHVLKLLLQNPRMGHPLEERDMREYSIPNLPFSLVYLVGEGRIEILRLWDQRGDREQLQEWIEDTSKP